MIDRLIQVLLTNVPVKITLGWSFWNLINYSMSKIAKRYLPIMTASLILRYPLRTYKWIQHVKCSIKIIHGTSDKLIPFKYGLALSKINPKITRLYSVIGSGHNDLYTNEEYLRMLEEVKVAK